MSLQLMKLPVPVGPKFTTETDAEGRFRFDGIPAGEYWLRPVPPGYLNTVDDGDGVGKKIVIEEGKSITDADLDITLGGVISGRVTDADGRPVADETVELTYADRHGRMGDEPDLEDYDIRTDSAGAYRIIGIPPGHYLISIGVDLASMNGERHYGTSYPHPDRSGIVWDDHYFEQTFYPGTTDRSRAKSVEILSGSEIKDLNFVAGTRFKAYSVRGRVVDAEGKPVTECRIEVGHLVRGGYSSRPISHSGQKSDADESGAFQITGLIPGRFFVNGRFAGECDLYSDPVQFEVTDKDVAGIEIKSHCGVTLSGSISIEGDEEKQATYKPGDLKLFLTWEQDVKGYSSREGSITGEGAFSIAGMRPGDVAIHLWPCSRSARHFRLLRVEYTKGSGADAKQEIVEAQVPMTQVRTAPIAAELPELPSGLKPPQPGASIQGPAVPPGDAMPIRPVPADPKQAGSAEPDSTLPGVTGYAPMPGALGIWVPSTLVPERFAPRVPVWPGWPSASLTLENRDMEGIRVVLEYHNARIKGHVDIAGGTLRRNEWLMAHISRTVDKRNWSTAQVVDSNGDFALEGLDPGTYQAFVGLPGTKLTETKTFELKKNKEVVLSFEADLDREMK